MKHFKRAFACGLGAATMFAGCGGEDMQGFPTSDGSEEQLIARAAAYELPTEYVPPPGEALHHHTAGFAKILCSGVFITGLDADDAAANVGGRSKQRSTGAMTCSTTTSVRRSPRWGCSAGPSTPPLPPR